MDTLKVESDTYAKAEQDLKKSAPGKFVLIKGSEIIGFFDDLDTALTEGTRRFGLEPYLVRHIGEPVQTITIPALTMGLIRADS